jgi:hypothetical protein
MRGSATAQYESRLHYFLLSELLSPRLLTSCLQWEKQTGVRGRGWLKRCDQSRSTVDHWASFLLFSAEIPLEDDYPNGINVYLMFSLGEKLNRER